MRWRKFKLDWKYGIGELIIVTAGVLIALAIDQWSNERSDRIEEALILDGLIADLESDQIDIAFFLDGLPTKEASLQRVYTQLTANDQRPRDPGAFLEDIITGSRYGWISFKEQRVTFDELLGSGRFNLIRDAHHRRRVAEYYEIVEEIGYRIEERETVYPNASYQLVPRINEFRLDPELTNEERVRLASRALDTLNEDIVLAEINFSRFLRGVLTEAEDARFGLISELRAYRDSIR